MRARCERAREGETREFVRRNIARRERVASASRARRERVRRGRSVMSHVRWDISGDTLFTHRA